MLSGANENARKSGRQKLTCIKTKSCWRMTTFYTSDDKHQPFHQSKAFGLSRMQKQNAIGHKRILLM